MRGSVFETKVIDERGPEDLSNKGSEKEIMRGSILDCSYGGPENFDDDFPKSKRKQASNVSIGHALQPREILTIHGLEEELGICSNKNLGACSHSSHVGLQQVQDADQLKKTNDFLRSNGFLPNFNKGTPTNKLKAHKCPSGRNFEKYEQKNATS